MDEHYVVIEDEQVHNQQTQVDDKCKEEAHETWIRICLPIVQVQLEKVSLPVLGGKVYYCY